MTFKKNFSIIYVESEGRKLKIQCSYTFLISFEIQNDDCSYDELLSICKEKGEEEGLPIEWVNDVEFAEEIWKIVKILIYLIHQLRLNGGLYD